MMSKFWKNSGLSYSPPDMRVLLRTNNGKLEVEKMEYDEVLFNNADKKGVMARAYQ